MASAAVPDERTIWPPVGTKGRKDEREKGWKDEKDERTEIRKDKKMKGPIAIVTGSNCDKNIVMTAIVTGCDWWFIRLAYLCRNCHCPR